MVVVVWLYNLRIGNPEPAESTQANTTRANYSKWFGSSVQNRHFGSYPFGCVSGVNYPGRMTTITLAGCSGKFLIIVLSSVFSDNCLLLIQ